MPLARLRGVCHYGQCCWSAVRPRLQGMCRSHSLLRFRTLFARESVVGSRCAVCRSCGNCKENHCTRRCCGVEIGTRNCPRVSPYAVSVRNRGPVVFASQRGAQGCLAFRIKSAYLSHPGRGIGAFSATPKSAREREKRERDRERKENCMYLVGCGATPSSHVKPHDGQRRHGHTPAITSKTIRAKVCSDSRAKLVLRESF